MAESALERIETILRGYNLDENQISLLIDRIEQACIEIVLKQIQRVGEEIKEKVEQCVERQEEGGLHNNIDTAELFEEVGALLNETRGENRIG